MNLDPLDPLGLNLGAILTLFAVIAVPCIMLCAWAAWRAYRGEN